MQAIKPPYTDSLNLYKSNPLLLFTRFNLMAFNRLFIFHKTPTERHKGALQ